DRIAGLEQWVLGDLRPDLTLLLDAPVDIGRERAGKRSTPDRFEQEQDAFFNRVRQAYLDRASHEPERIKVIDASVELGEVAGQIRNVVERYL
ncbi:MAG: dTMP kinase, partial [Candidatus Pacearchaeota archaeon]|nr:dTMP kinase [Candidatus Pacearchaeota archaeon]